MRVTVLINVLSAIGAIIFLFANPIAPYWDQQELKRVAIQIPFLEHEPLSISTPNRIGSARVMEDRTYVVYRSYNYGPWYYVDSFTRREVVRDAISYEGRKSKTVADGDSEYEILLIWGDGNFFVYVNDLFIPRSAFDFY